MTPINYVEPPDIPAGNYYQVPANPFGNDPNPPRNTFLPSLPGR